MATREGIMKVVCSQNNRNAIIVRDLDKFNINNYIGYRIDDIIISSKYKDTTSLSNFIYKILPNITVAGVIKVNIYYCEDLD